MYTSLRVHIHSQSTLNTPSPLAPPRQTGCNSSQAPGTAPQGHTHQQCSLGWGCSQTERQAQPPFWWMLQWHDYRVEYAFTCWTILTWSLKDGSCHYYDPDSYVASSSGSNHLMTTAICWQLPSVHNCHLSNSRPVHVSSPKGISTTIPSHSGTFTEIYKYLHTYVCMYVHQFLPSFIH